MKLRVEQLQAEESSSRDRQLQLEQRFETLKKTSSEMEASYSSEFAELQELVSTLRITLTGKEERLVGIYHN